MIQQIRSQESELLGIRHQGWNADGYTGTNCGAGGFGFNTGDYSQDICLDAARIGESSVEAATPLYVTTGPVTPTCDGVDLLSKGRS